MSDVSSRACAPILAALRCRGVDPAPLLEGLPFTLDDLEASTGRIAWDGFATLLERVAARVGGEEGLRALAWEQFAAPLGGVLAALARQLGTPRTLYVLGARWYGPAFFPTTRATLEDLPGGRLRQCVEILPPHRDSPEFFQLMRGVLEIAPVALQRPRARVEMQLGPRQAVYLVTPPPPVSWAARIGRLFRGEDGLAEALAELQLQQAELEDAHRREREKSAALAAEIEARMRGEERLRNAQKMEAVGLLAGGLAHEFSNILTAIGAYADLARGAPAEEWNDHLDEIRLAVTRGTGLLRRLLAFGRRPMTLRETLDLNTVLLDIEPMLSALLGGKIAITIDPGHGLHAVRADRGQLEQVIVNLAVNARDAMPRGGSLVLETENVGASELPDLPGGGVRLRVRDSGEGMDEATRARAFEPFFTTKPRERGTGLGLFAVWGIIGQHGGHVSLESEPGKGTLLDVVLPRAEGDTYVAAGAGVPRGVPGGRETLLLVEDEAQVRSVTAALLEAAGYTVLAASDAAEALTLAESCSGPIDLIVTDVVLPGVDGREAARRLQAARPDLRRVLFVSGHADELDSGAGPSTGRAFLRKPYTREALLRAVRRLLDT